MSAYLNSLFMYAFIHSVQLVFFKIFKIIKILVALHYLITITKGISYIYIKSTFLAGFKVDNNLALKKLVFSKP